MERSWTFGRKVGAGFAAIVVLVVVIAVGSIYGLSRVSSGKGRVIDVDARTLIFAGRLRTAAEWKASELRGYLLIADDESLAAHRDARADFLATLRALRALPLDREGGRLLGEIEQTEAEHQRDYDQLIARRQAGETAEATGRAFRDNTRPRMNLLREQMRAFVDHQEELLAAGSAAATRAADRTTAMLIGLAGLAALLAVALATLLTRALNRQIGSAVQHVQSSSAELQSAANQQATGAKEQASAMNEITTTINELLATSRQIAESAQRVAQIADDTARAARSGDLTVGKTGTSIATIKRQVDLIVAHMLDLGKKSQQIGGVLEIINELAEQTNILAINATIEAVGAGEAGKRFAVVADEIRKLADRVGGATKEIRTLIDEVRGAVNTTVMTTEGGSKAVDAGARQFAEVSAALADIVGSVSTTTEAAREIELSTKQQATAVEQVNVAISSVAQATRETEVSASQTLQTASQLTILSRDLMRLIRPSSSS
jgi:methyl-accepting chemotaxis protein